MTERVLYLVRDILRLVQVLHNLDHAESSSVLQLSDENLLKLKEFRSLILPAWNRGEQAESLDQSAFHLLHYINVNDAAVIGTTYHSLHDMIENIQNSGSQEVIIHESEPAVKLEPTDPDDRTVGACEVLLKQAKQKSHPCSKAVRKSSRKTRIGQLQKSNSPKQSCTGTFSGRVKRVYCRRMQLSDRPTFDCPVCSKKYTYEGFLRQHLEQHRQDLAKEHRSSVAGIDTAESSVKNLPVDKAISGPPSHKCLSCDMQFLFPSLLKEHEKSHGTERPHQCHTCGKSFKRLGDLNIHIRFHDSSLHYRCQDCDRSFPWKNSYVRHRRMHTGEKPYLCTKCGRAFGGFSNHRKHMLLHLRDAAIEKHTAVRQQHQ